MEQNPLMPEENQQQNNGSITSSEPNLNGNKSPLRSDDGKLLPGTPPLNPAGRPKNSVSITEAIKRRLGDIYHDPSMPMGDKKSYLESIIDAIMHNALVNRDQKALKDIWNYIDGLPKGSFDVGVDREGLAELTEFMKGLANPKGDGDKA